MEKDSFILYTEQKDVIDKLTDEDAGKLIKAIYEYAKTGELTNVNPLVDIVIIPFRQSIDRNNDKWNEEKQKRSEAGKKGMANRWGSKKNNNDNNVITEDNKNNSVINTITRHNKNN